MINTECNYKVSVVIPVYNTEKYLKQCMNSVLSQKLENIEIICVDDGSTDNSGAILDEYAKRDDRVKVIHKSNAGYGQSVNLGIEHSHGEYVGIVEPDDYIKPLMYQTLYSLAADNDLDFISSHHEKFMEMSEGYVYQETRIVNDPQLYNRVINPLSERGVYKGNYINPAGLFKKTFLNENDIRHNETPGASYQDIGFCFQVLACAKRMMLIAKSFYCYRQDNPNSSIASKGKANCVIDEYQYIYEKVLKKHKLDTILMAEYQRRRFGSYLYTFERVTKENKLEFLYEVQKEYLISKEKNELDLSVFYDSWRAKLEMIMYEPFDYYNRYNQIGAKLNDIMKNYTKVIIYGAGVNGMRALDLMWHKDREKIIGYAVTSQENNVKMYKGYVVKAFKRYKNITNDVLVLVCVKEQFRKEIEDMIKKREIANAYYFDFGHDEIVF